MTITKQQFALFATLAAALSLAAGCASDGGIVEGSSTRYLSPCPGISGGAL